MHPLSSDLADFHPASRSYYPRKILIAILAYNPYNGDPNALSRSQYDLYQHQQAQHLQQSQQPSSHPISQNPYGIPSYTSYNQSQHGPYANTQLVDDDSEFYEPPGGLPSRPHHEPPRAAHEVDNPELYANFPEEPNAYLLKQFDAQNDYRRAYGRTDPQEPIPQAQMQQHHGVGFPTNFYHGYNDSEQFAPEDVDNFQPFPIAGDSYPLNTYDDDTETLYSSTLDQSERSTPVQPETPGMEPTQEQFPPGVNIPPQNLAATGAPQGPAFLPPPGQPMPIPAQPQPRRAANTKNVQLYKGNLVLDCPVPEQFLGAFDPETVKEREFTHMRYSAATCDPDDFGNSRFTLRQKCYRQARETEIFIAITIYNEDDLLLARTLSGVFKNIKHLVMRTNTSTWGQNAWKKIVVCVIADGRNHIHERSKGLMARLGVYQDGLAKNLVADKPVHAHIYEYTTMAGIKSVDKIVNFTSKRTIPVQMIFCMKERNQKKINSHRWFFNAFGQILKPKVCVLLDAGTEPSHDSIYHLWKAFDQNPRIGGACGEIRAGLGKAGNKLLNPLVAAQNFEYKMSNILDKPMESVFGFITVLPGAFSAYRFEALQNNANGEGPLNKYFKGETLHDSNAGIFTANMYLAEDRILCFELVAKRDSRWLLKYVKSAHAVTDVPENLSELVLQRRRWLNGSFFAAIYSISHTYSLWRSSHSLLRKLFLHIEFLYQLVSILFSWFSIGNFFLVFRILTNSLGDSALGFGPGKVLSVVFLWMYCACIVSIFVLSFGNRPKGTQLFYIIVVIFFAVLMAYLLFAAIYISVKSVTYTLCMNDNRLTVALVFGNPLFRDLVVSLMSTYALYFVSSFLFFEPWHMFTSFLQYLLISPSYINVLNVYAFCNIHDISWGTKGDDGLKMDLGVAKLNQTGGLEVNVPTHLKDIDNMYTKYQVQLETPAPKETNKPVNEQEKNTDYYALFRSSVVLIWIFTNLVIIAVVLNTAGLDTITGSDSTDSNTDNSLVSMLSRRSIESVSGFIQEVSELMARQTTDTDTNNCGSIGSSGSVQSEIYLTVILWCVAALAAFRFIGAVLYMVFRLFGY